MSDIIVPEVVPPLVTPQAKDKLIDDIFSQGLEKIWSESLDEFRMRQPAIYSYVKHFDFLDSEGNPLADDRPKKAFRYGALLTELAYQESGYDQTIHDVDTFILAQLGAKCLGIPEAYIIQSSSDKALEELVSLMSETPQMRDGAEVYGSYEHFLRIGAGCTRHYMQFALTTAGDSTPYEQ